MAAQLLSMKSDTLSVYIMNNPDQTETNTLESIMKTSKTIEDLNTILLEELDKSVNTIITQLCIISILVSPKTVEKLSYQSNQVLMPQELVEVQIYLLKI